MLSCGNSNAVFPLCEHLLFKELAKAKNAMLGLRLFKILFILEIYIFTAVRNASCSSGLRA